LRPLALGVFAGWLVVVSCHPYIHPQGYLPFLLLPFP
jgi:hypothetical protein